MAASDCGDAHSNVARPKKVPIQMNNLDLRYAKLDMKQSSRKEHFLFSMILFLCLHSKILKKITFIFDK